MLDKIKKILALIGLARVADQADGNAELDALKRLGKGLLIALLSVLLDTIAKQAGAGCALGAATCAVLNSPLVQPALFAGLLGAEKYLNERFGITITVLDTQNR